MQHWHWLFNLTLHKTEPAHQLPLPELCRLPYAIITSHNFRCGWCSRGSHRTGDLFHSGGNESPHAAACSLYVLSSEWICVCACERERRHSSKNFLTDLHMHAAPRVQPARCDLIKHASRRHVLWFSNNNAFCFVAQLSYEQGPVMPLLCVRGELLQTTRKPVALRCNKTVEGNRPSVCVCAVRRPHMCVSMWRAAECFPPLVSD